MIAALDFTFDPVNPVILLFEVIWFGAAAAMFLGAWKTKSEWMKASLAGFALSIVAIRVLAVLPSWWLYYAEGTLDWGGQGCAEIDLQCIKQTVKDTVVVVQNAVTLGAFVVGFMIWQKKFPKQLAPGEPKPEATGGYK